MLEIRKTKVVRNTWLGVKGVSTTHHLDSKTDGLRIHCLELETNEIVPVQLIEGDGRDNASFRKVSERYVPRNKVAETVKEFQEHAARWVGKKAAAR